MAPGVAPFVAAATGGARPPTAQTAAAAGEWEPPRQATDQPGAGCRPGADLSCHIMRRPDGEWKNQPLNRRGRAPLSNLRPTSVSKQIIRRPTRGAAPLSSPPPFTCISPLSLTRKHRRHIISLAPSHRQQFVPPTDVCYNSLHFTADETATLIERHTVDIAFNSVLHRR
jgi:hypothetical protein